MDYENAVLKLNFLLHINPLTTRRQYQKFIEKARKYILRADVSLEDLDKLSVIHITGTKGKGSTCALTESILRHHGYRTGLVASPHVLEVRERICINGLPISEQDFAYYFWQIYSILDERKESENDLPKPFTMVLIMAFKIFLTEKVDVAIIECCVGGEYDATSILRAVPVIGITSLDLDHTTFLGNTIEEIAWHKAGVMKPGSRVYTVPQVQPALEVFKKRCIERNCLSLQIVELHNFSVLNDKYPKDIFNLNSNLAVAVSQAWINHTYKLGNVDALEMDFKNSGKTVSGISNFQLPARFQVIEGNFNNFYIDGAHTHESIKICAAWFNKMTSTSQRKTVLAFNTTGDRNSEDLLQLLVGCKFNKVFFVPSTSISSDITNINNGGTINDEQITRCHSHYKIWTSFETTTETVKVLPSIMDALNECPMNYDVLVTGSLYLAGATLKIIGTCAAKKLQ